MDKVKQVVDKVVHPKDHSSTTHSSTTTGTTTHGSSVTGTHGTAGPHSSNLANKADVRVDSDRDGSRNMGATQYGAGAHTTTHGTTGMTGSHNTAGPHRSDALNSADPRVDSDLDGSRNMGAAQYGTGAHNTHGTHGTTGLGSSTTHGTTAGKPSLVDRMNPMVDSDNDGSRNMGMAQRGAGAHHTASGSTNHGPHSSNLANSADPRIDSDLDGSRTAGGAGVGSHGTTGLGSGTTGYGHSTTHGTSAHNPNQATMGQKLNPMVDSDNDGSRNMGMAKHGAGAHQTASGSTNAGPHSSNMLNKLDPRVDSDRDGSKTMGNNQRY